MRALRTRAAAALVLLAIGVSSRAGENDSRAECTFNPRSFRSAEMMFHELSERAELVVPSMQQRGGDSETAAAVTGPACGPAAAKMRLNT